MYGTNIKTEELDYYKKYFQLDIIYCHQITLNI
jgi:hypothetical protein